MNPCRKRILIAAIGTLLAILIAFGGVLAVRGDYRYRLGLLFRKHGEVDLQAVMPEKLTEYTLAELLNDPRVCEDQTLLLVNSEYSMPKEFNLDFALRNGHSLHAVAAEAFDAMASAVKRQTGEDLLIRSAYRDPTEQAAELEQYGESQAARPGYSEHETGLALDLCTVGYGGASFLKTEAGRLVNDTCGAYGFIIRYPYGKSSVTGFSYEPWHVRYVGAPHAQIIMESGIALEEYLALLSPDVWYQTGDYLILRTAAETLFAPREFTSCTVSNDNLGYRVFTFYMGECGS